MRVLAVTSKRPSELPPYVTPVSPDTLFKTADVISLHCPLTSSTRHMVNATTLAMVRPGAIIINTGRGDLVDEEAVAQALTQDWGNPSALYDFGIHAARQLRSARHAVAAPPAPCPEAAPRPRPRPGPQAPPLPGGAAPGR